MAFIPAWKDKDGNRFIVLAENHVFDNEQDARDFQISGFLNYVPFGWSPSGVVEVALENGKGQIPHVLCDGPYRSQCAVIAGPLFEEFQL